MKRCPRCGQGYTDASINFCLNDGELLAQFEPDEPPTLFTGGNPPTQFADDAPPTVVMGSGRTTNASYVPSGGPPAPWGSASPVSPSYGIGNFQLSQDKTLPTIAMILGICAAVMVCCWGGVWLGVPAAIVGFLGMRNAESDPTRYGGRGMAVAGMVLGIITFLASMIFGLFGLFAR